MTLYQLLRLCSIREIQENNCEQRTGRDVECFVQMTRHLTGRLTNQETR
jgi:hypothetical protein